MAALPPRRVVNVSRVNRQPSSPLQVLLQMGFPKHRAEKALAATGDRGVQLAADWLLAHVNDPTLDDSAPREYILYLCPTGPLLEQLQNFYSQSLLKCGWNGAHNYLPHITLCSFFQAPDDGISHLVHALKHVVEKLKMELPERIALEHYTSPTFLGLFVAEEHNDLLKRLAVQFMREVSDFIVAEMGALDVLGTCFPWCSSSYPSLTKGSSRRRIQVEPYLKALHITLAYQFQPAHYSVLEELCRNINTNAAAGWELRLYSRDPRIKGNEVHKVLYSHVPQESDELELLIGDFVYVSGEQLANSADGWVEGTSWLTGCTGYLPKSYIERTSESDAWTLHKSIPLSKNASMDDVDQNPVARRPSIAFLNQSSESLQDKSTKKASAASATNKGGAVQKDKAAATAALKYPQTPTSTTANTKVRSDDQQAPSSPKESLRQLYVVRHAERIDFTFGTWIPYCFDSSGNYTRKDLNMPLTVPHRSGGPQDFLKDCPLTNIGLYQATLTGEAMKEAGVSFSHVFCSPSLRCVQTGTNILKALGKDATIPICIEPGLFEWLAWYQDSMPVWMTTKELKECGFNIKMDYRPLITQEELQDKQESSEQYYMRSFFVTQAVLKNTAGSNVLLVGHAATLDSCTRQLVNRSPRSANDLIHLVHKIPYCSVAVAEEDSDGSWSLVSPPFPPLMHSGTIRFDWKCLLT